VYVREMERKRGSERGNERAKWNGKRKKINAIDAIKLDRPIK
jgi:hypothetical protein